MNYNLLICYLSGESNAHEQYLVKQWLKSDPEHRRLLEELELIWEASGKSHEDIENDFDAGADWEVLRSRIERVRESNISEEKNKLKLGKTGQSYRHLRPAMSSGFAHIMRIAAVLLIAALIGVYAWQNFHVIEPGQEELAMREIVMEKGQRANMVLSDGTNLNLNADTRISMPETFQSDKREVYLLEGEAFFDVAGDPDRPFLIHSGGAVIHVLGTSFAVRAYPEDETVRVVVNEGTVSLAPGLEENMGIALSAGQLGHFHVEDNSITSEDVEDMELFLSWIDGYLKFNDASMKDVALQLERRYNVEVDFSDPALEELRLTAVLKGRSISNVLNVITASLEIGYYEPDRQTIVFTDKY